MNKVPSYARFLNEQYHITRNGVFRHKCAPNIHHTYCGMCCNFDERYDRQGDPENVCEKCKSEFSLNKTTVSLKAVFVVNGDWEGKSRRSIMADMHADKIIKEKSFSNAVAYFKSQVPDIDHIEDVEYFYIDDKMYDSNFWSK